LSPIESKPRAGVARAVFFLLAATFVVIRLWNIQTFCLDSDEVFSLACAQAPWTALFQKAAFDLVHPPLFYILLKVWIGIGGDSLVWVRLLPALFSFLSLVPFYFLCRGLGLSQWQMNFALALLCLDPDQVFHSQYLRMYSLLFFLSLCSYWAFTPRRNLWLLGTINVVLVYTHYYGWAVIASEGLYILWVERKRLPGFLACSGVVFVAFVPWLMFASHFAVMRGGLNENLGWIRRPSLSDLFTFYVNLTTPHQSLYLSAAFMLLAALCVVLSQFIGVHRRLNTFLLIAALLPPLASFAISQFFPQSVWGTRHLIIAIVPFYLLLAISFSIIPLQKLRPAAVAFVAAWIALSLPQLIHPRPRINYEVLAEMMILREPGVDRVQLLIPDRFLKFPLAYQLDRHDPGRWDARTITSLDSGLINGHFWVAYHRDRWKGAKSPAQLLRERGYRVGPGIWVSDDWHRVIALPVWPPGSEIAASSIRRP
jgi:hypothetical protein